jgi:hemerythrin superfamily protein
MPRTDTNSSTHKSKKDTAPPSQDAISMLVSDHREVERGFEEYENLGDDSTTEKKKLADRICKQLEQHMALEEELFYPAVKKELKGSEDMVNEAIVEHSSAKELMKQIKSMKGDEQLFDSKVLVLKELIEHHVEEEEEEMFAKTKKSSLDLEALGEKMTEMKQKT